MQVTKILIAVFISLTVLCTGLRYFPLTDYNHDHRVDLKDAIMATQISTGNADTILAIVAEEKMLAKDIPGAFSPDRTNKTHYWCLSTSPDHRFHAQLESILIKFNISYLSLPMEPQTPPPKIGALT